MDWFPDAEMVRSRWLRLSPNARAVVWALLSVVTLSASDAVAKALGRHLHPLEISFLRFSLSLVLMSPALILLGRNLLATERPIMHVFRAAITAIAQVLVYYALTRMILADVTALVFAAPLFVTILAVIVLGERVDGRRWMATGLGFVGVLVMVRPGAGSFDPMALLPIISAALFGLALVMVRRFSATESAFKFAFYYQLVGTVILVVPAAFVWQWPTTDQLPLVILLAVLGTVAQLFAMLAYTTGASSVVAQALYFRLIVAALLGFIVFGEVPGVPTWIGGGIIVAASLYVSRRGARSTRPSGETELGGPSR